MDTATFGLDEDTLQAARAAGTLPELQLLQEGDTMPQSPALSYLQLGYWPELENSMRFRAMHAVARWPFKVQTPFGDVTDHVRCLALLAFTSGYKVYELATSMAVNEEAGIWVWNAAENRYDSAIQLAQHLRDASLQEQKEAAQRAWEERKIL